VLLDRYKNGNGTNNAANVATAVGQPSRNEGRPSKSQPQGNDGQDRRAEAMRDKRMEAKMDANQATADGKQEERKGR
jgi:hypothetical protein